ncbi:MAG: hypothetical protein Q4Q58_06680 [Thermoplasmata archaeon]|nr:hypothetical protein [Thermoplasmata archaeon]
MVPMIIVHSSKSGSSKRYAEELASRTGLRCYPVGSDLPEGEPIVFFGWNRGDYVVGLNKVDKSRLKTVCVVGLDDEGRFDGRKVSDRNRVTVPVYYLRGWIDRSKLNLLDKGVLALVAAMMKLRGLNEHNRPIFDAMMEGGSFYYPSYLDSIELFIGSAGS